MFSRITILGFATALIPLCAQADEAEIVVTGRAAHRIGTAVSASEGSVSGADLADRPLLRPGELLEAVPGLIATQHSGGGKANQYFLRGFDLDHGTDFAVAVDDMPVNFPSHGHGQGYLDVNGLIPEAVQRIDYRKGPYRAAAGDFSFVGGADVVTHDRLPSFVTAESGSYGYGRLVAGGSTQIGGGDLLWLGQLKHQDGPWNVPEDFNSASTLVKYSRDTALGVFRVSLSTYDARWRPTDQIPQRALGTRLSGPFDSLDANLTGRTSRQIVTAGLTGDNDRNHWRVTGWAQHYDWSLLSNFTFYLDDPVGGDEIRQYEKRWSYGGRAENRFAASDKLDLTYGMQARVDDIGTIGLDHATAGIADAVTARFGIRERSLSAYGEALYRPTGGWQIVAGLRADTVRFETTARGGNAWSGKASDSLWSPKLGVNYAFSDHIAAYANWGEGFHSNDARGVTNPADPVPGLVKGEFKELGGRYELGSLRLSGVYWWNHIDSELIYAADSGIVEPNDAARRQGYELTAFWKPLPGVSLDAVWARNAGELEGLPKGANAIPGAVRNTGEAGVTFEKGAWNAGLRLRYLGPRDLIEDRSQIGKASTLVNLRTAWQASRRVQVYAEVLNLFDRPAHDIDYYYATRLPGEPVSGVEDLTFHMSEPRQFRVGIKIGN